MTTIEIIKEDITRLNVDCIVNAANNSLMGGGGVDGAIHKAAGIKLAEECRKLKGCKTGEAKVTRAYNLPASYIIHTVGPAWNNGTKNEEKLLASCYKESLFAGRKLEISSIAFPAISTGAYRFPFKKAAKIALREIQSFIKTHPNAYEEIILCLYNEKEFNLMSKEMNKNEY